MSARAFREASLEVDRWMVEIRRLAEEAGPHMTGEQWAENTRLFEQAQRAHAAAVARMVKA